MAGLLGMMVAGGIKGYSDQRFKEIDEQNKFDMSKALIDANYEKNLMLKKSGYQMDDERDQAKRKEVTDVMEGAKSKSDTAGGYESEEQKTKREKGLLKTQADALSSKGYFDAADTLYKRVDAENKNELSLAQLEAKKEQILGMIENQKDRNRIMEELGDAKNANQLAQVQVQVEKMNAAADRAKASSERNNARTYDERLYQAYVDDVKQNGRPDKNGKISHNPLSMDVWDKKHNKKDEENNFEEVTTKKATTDRAGDIIEETTIKRKQPISKVAPPEVGRYVQGKGIVYD